MCGDFHFVSPSIFARKNLRAIWDSFAFTQEKIMEDIILAVIWFICFIQEFENFRKSKSIFDLILSAIGIGMTIHHVIML